METGDGTRSALSTGDVAGDVAGSSFPQYPPTAPPRIKFGVGPGDNGGQIVTTDGDRGVLNGLPPPPPGLLNGDRVRRSMRGELVSELHVLEPVPVPDSLAARGEDARELAREMARRAQRASIPSKEVPPVLLRASLGRDGSFGFAISWSDTNAFISLA